MAPYLMGMMAAYHHLNSTKFEGAIALLMEWIAFILVVLISHLGGKPVWKEFEEQLLLVSLDQQYWLIMIVRPIFGASLAYLVRQMVSTDSKESAWYWPHRLLGSFLSLPLFIPLAYLSYSFYLLHVPMV